MLQWPWPTHEQEEGPLTSPETHALPIAVWALLALLLIQALDGLLGGIALVAGPRGEILRMPLSYLKGSPFPDYRIPGIILLTVLGLFPLVAAAGLWRRQRWAWYASLAVGCGLVIWLAVQVIIIPFNPLQAVIAVEGLTIAVLTLLPSVRRYCLPRIVGDD